MKFFYIMAALSATAMAAPEMSGREAVPDVLEREAALTCNYRCLAPVRRPGVVSCPCGNQARPCYIYNCQGGTSAIGGKNAQIFRRY